MLTTLHYKYHNNHHNHHYNHKIYSKIFRNHKRWINKNIRNKCKTVKKKRISNKIKKHRRSK